MTNAEELRDRAIHALGAILQDCSVTWQQQRELLKDVREKAAELMQSLTDEYDYEAHAEDDG